MGDGAQTIQDKKLTVEQVATEKAKPVLISPTALDGARKDTKSNYVNAEQAYFLFRKLQEVTGEKLPQIITSKGERLQLVESTSGYYLGKNTLSEWKPASFFLSHESSTEYHFDEKGKFTHGKQFHGKPSKEAKYGIKSQEFLREIKTYLENKCGCEVLL